MFVEHVYIFVTVLSFLYLNDVTTAKRVKITAHIHKRF